MKNLFILLIVLISVLIIGCSASKHASQTTGFGFSDSDNFNTEVYGVSDVSISAAGYQEKAFIKKVIYSASIDLSVRNVDSTAKQLERITKQFDGYVVQMSSYTAMLRVKSENLNQALAQIENLGKVLDKDISGNDVSEEYTDNQIRLENAEKARQRYLELLSKAENVQAALSVEKELERLNSQIELLNAKLNKTDHLVQYSTIDVSFKEAKKPGILGYIGLGFYYTLKWLFVRN